MFGITGFEVTILNRLRGLEIGLVFFSDWVGNFTEWGKGDGVVVQFFESGRTI